jgi:hypothetical protein
VRHWACDLTMVFSFVKVFKVLNCTHINGVALPVKKPQRMINIRLVIMNVFHPCLA